MSSGAGYNDFEVPFRFVDGRASYLCPENKTLFYQPGFGGDGGQEQRIFCYEGRTKNNFFSGNRFDDTEFNYTGITTPININYTLQLRLQPGTENEYVSPIFLGNTRTGFVTQRDPS